MVEEERGGGGGGGRGGVGGGAEVEEQEEGERGRGEDKGMWWAGGIPEGFWEEATEEADVNSVTEYPAALEHLTIIITYCNLPAPLLLSIWNERNLKGVNLPAELLVNLSYFISHNTEGWDVSRHPQFKSIYLVTSSSLAH